MYGYGGINDNANELYSRVMTGTYGSRDPFNIPSANTTFNVPQPSIPGLLLDLVLRNTIGTRNIFTLPKLDEPAAGDIGAYAYAKFRSNQTALGSVNGQIAAASRRALGSALAPAIGTVAGLDEKQTEELIADFEKGDAYGITNMGADFAKRALGMPDYGVTGMEAVKHRTGFLLSGMSQYARDMLTDLNPISSNWSSRENSVVREFDKKARAAMYTDGFIRNEDFMRGFRESDIAPILTQVASGARSSADLDDRIKNVGAAAIKTLEAYKDLFGSAEKANAFLNQITAGGLSTMTATQLDSLTNQARGLMRLGELNGMSPQAVASVVGAASATVQGGLGYTPSDDAGGYVNDAVVNGLATGFAAQQLANMGAEGRNSLNPVEAQKLRARAAWQAGQWSQSRAGQAQIAFQYAIARGAIAEGSDQAKQIEAMFRSGDVHHMANAANIVAQALGVDVETLHDTAFVRTATDVVGKDQNRLDALVDIGVESSTTEARTKFEQTASGNALDAARRNASAGGVSNKRMDETEKRTKVNTIKRMLRENSASPDAKRALEYLETIERQSGGDMSKVFAGADEALGMLDNKKAADAIRTEAEFSAAGAVDNLARGNELYGVTNRMAATLVKRLGGKLGAGGGIERIDALQILGAIQSSQGVQTNATLKNLVNKALKPNSSNEDVTAALNAAGDLVALAKDRVSFENPVDKYRDGGSSTKFGSDIANMLSGKRGVESKRTWTLGGKDTTDNFEDVMDKVDDAGDRLGASVNQKSSTAEEEHNKRVRDLTTKFNADIEAVDKDDRLSDEEKEKRKTELEDKYAADMAKESARTADETAATLNYRSAESKKNRLEQEWEDVRDKAKSDARAVVDAEYSRKLEAVDKDDRLSDEEKGRRRAALAEVHDRKVKEAEEAALKSDKVVSKTRKLEDQIQEQVRVMADSARKLGLSGEDVDFLTALGGENGSMESYTLDGQKINTKEFGEKTRELAAGLESFDKVRDEAKKSVIEEYDKKIKAVDEDESLTQEQKDKKKADLEKERDSRAEQAENKTMFREMERIHRLEGKATEQEQKDYRALIRKFKNKGFNISSVFNSGINPDSLVGDVATAELVSEYGGEMVAGDVFRSAFTNAGEKNHMSPDQLKDIGSRVQDIVNDNSARAYATGGQALLRGLQTGDWSGIADTFIRKDASQDERKAVIGYLKSTFGDLVGEDGKIDPKKKEELLGRFFENFDKISEFANNTADLVSGGFGENVSNKEANSTRKLGESEESPVFVKIVDGKVSVNSGDDTPAEALR